MYITARPLALILFRLLTIVLQFFPLLLQPPFCYAHGLLQPGLYTSTRTTIKANMFPSIEPFLASSPREQQPYHQSSSKPIYYWPNHPQPPYHKQTPYIIRVTHIPTLLQNLTSIVKYFARNLIYLSHASTFPQIS